MSKQFNSATRYFNKIEVLPGGWLKKTSTYSSKFIDEVNWFVNLPKELKPFVPSVKCANAKRVPYSITYKFLTSPTLHAQMCFSNIKKSYWRHVRNEYHKFLNLCKDFKPIKFDKEYWENNLKEMYITKTLDRLNKVLENPNLKFWFENKYVMVNGKQYPSISTLVKFLKDGLKCNFEGKQYDALNKIITPSKSTICLIHGDLVFSNVFIYQRGNEYEFKCIDPRGGFGKDKNYGDLIYDYAKIYQSIFGLYDFVLEGDFDYRFDGKNIKYWVQPNNNAWKCQKVFKRFFPKIYLNRIKLVEALQFLSMVPLHNDRIDHQKIFLAHGIVRFCNAMGKKWKL